MKKIADTDTDGIIALYREGYTPEEIGKMLEPPRSRGFVYMRTNHIKGVENKAQAQTRARQQRLSKLAETMSYNDVAAQEGVGQTTVAVAVIRFPHSKPRKSMRSTKAAKKPKRNVKIKPIKLDDDMAKKVRVWRLRGSDAHETSVTLRRTGMKVEVAAVQAYYDTMPPLKIGFMGMPTYA